MLGDIGSENTDLTVVHFADSAAVLSGNADRVLAFFDETAFIKNQCTFRATEIVIYDTTIFGNHFLFIPRRIADKTLHSSDMTFFHGQGDRLNGFAFKWTELPSHIVKKVLPGFTTLKAIAKLFVKANEFVHKILNIAFAKIVTL